MKTITVKLIPLGKEIQTRAGTPCIDLLHGYGVEFPCGGKGTCGKCRIKVLKGEITADAFHAGRLSALGLENEWKLACLSTCSTDLELEIGQYNALIQVDESAFEFIPSHGLGVAFDLGTTTLAAQLLDLASGKVLAVETAMNPQRRFGSDLITRLEVCLRDGCDEMTRIIRARVGEMIAQMMMHQTEALERIAIVGNTVMHHFFCGRDIRSLSCYPFESPNLDMGHFTSDMLGWSQVKCNDVSFYPSIGSFVGSDILAGILATGMHRKEGYSVLIDLGTNGEIVVGNSTRLLCSSTAAGPAFEGARISCGMQATTGAISSIDQVGDAWRSVVIGNTEPIGICGSGLIDAIRILLDAGLIGEFGEIHSGETAITLETNIALTQKDIQEFQLAKAAIASGIAILLRKLGIQSRQVEEIYIAGGFGSYINLENVIRVGMLDFPVDRIHKLGNSALLGGKMFLFEDDSYPETILKITEHVSLESEPGFQDIFVGNLAFKPI
ncbi:MAG: ASKHA domain-containing protein [Bacteroidota bacterium]